MALLTTCIHDSSDQNSILGSINTGFGQENSLSLNPNCGCSKGSTYLHLYKETYLSEFETAEEKAEARFNLGVPSVAEVDSAISLKLLSYATKADVDRVVAGTLSLQNYYTKNEVDDKLDSLELDLDTIPTKNSGNGVTSGGVWKYLDDTVGAIHRYTQTI